MSLEVTIDKFQDGIADSPGNGFANFQGLDVFASPGYVRMYPEIIDEVNSEDDGIDNPTYFEYDPVSDIYFCQDSQGQIWAKNGGVSGAWTLITGNTLTGALGQGICVWQGYLFVFRTNAIDLLDISTTFTTTDWTNGWKNQQVTYNGGAKVPSGLVDNQSFVSNFNGNKLVFTIYVSSTTRRAFIMTISTVFGKQFDPADAATYQYLQNADDPGVGQPIVIPLTGLKITCVEQLGALLYFGTSSNLIYPWDQVSIYVDTPLVSPETYVQSMKRVDNILYASVGERGNIYASNGSVVELFKRFPIFLYQSAANSSSSSHGNGQVEIPKIEAMKGRLIMCVRGFSDNEINGLYILNLQTRALVMYNTAPERPNAQIRTVIPSQEDSDRYFLGYSDNSYAAIASQRSGFKYPSDYVAFMETPFYNLGQKLNPESIQRMMLMFTTPLTSTQRVRISYRTNLYDAYTPILPTSVFTSTTEPSPYVANGFDFPTSIEKAVNVQFKIEITANSTGGSSNNTPELQQGIFYNNK